LPSPAKAPPTGPDWLHEIKHDGFPILARRDANGVRLITRNGNDFTKRFPLVVAAVAMLPARSAFENVSQSPATRGTRRAPSETHCTRPDASRTNGTRAPYASAMSLARNVTGAAGAGDGWIAGCHDPG
jgi:hypothetical protein